VKGLKAASASERFYRDKLAVRLEVETLDIVVDSYGDRPPTLNTLEDLSLLNMTPSSEYDRVM